MFYHRYPTFPLSLSSIKSDDPVEKNKQRFIETMRGVGTMPSASSMRKLLLSTVFWIGFGMFGWYFPRSIIHRETSILSLQPPFQISGGDTVIVDFELNQPLVDPPTVDSEFTFLKKELFGFNQDCQSFVLNDILNSQHSFSAFRQIFYFGARRSGFPSSFSFFIHGTQNYRIITLTPMPMLAPQNPTRLHCTKFTSLRQ